MRIILTEQDFEAAGNAPLSTDISAGPNLDDSQRAREILDLLPRVLSTKLKEVWTDLGEYKLQAFEVSLKVGGSPFGVGLDGSVVLKYER